MNATEQEYPCLHRPHALVGVFIGQRREIFDQDRPVFDRSSSGQLKTAQQAVILPDAAELGTNLDTYVLNGRRCFFFVGFFDGFLYSRVTCGSLGGYWDDVSVNEDLFCRMCRRFSGCFGRGSVH